MNNFVDTNKCVITPVLSFNIFESPEYQNFIDPDLSHRETLRFVRDEQAKRIEKVKKSPPTQGSNSVVGTQGANSYSYMSNDLHLNTLFSNSKSGTSQKPAGI